LAACRADVVRAVSNAKPSAADRVISAAFLLSPVSLFVPPARSLLAYRLQAWPHQIVQSRLIALIRLPTTSFGERSRLPETPTPRNRRRGRSCRLGTRRALRWIGWQGWIEGRQGGVVIVRNIIVEIIIATCCHYARYFRHPACGCACRQCSSGRIRTAQPCKFLTHRDTFAKSSSFGCMRAMLIVGENNSKHCGKTFHDGDSCIDSPVCVMKGPHCALARWLCTHCERQCLLEKCSYWN
jgi:hypothetical protein